MNIQTEKKTDRTTVRVQYLIALCLILFPFGTQLTGQSNDYSLNTPGPQDGMEVSRPSQALQLSANHTLSAWVKLDRDDFTRPVSSRLGIVDKFQTGSRIAYTFFYSPIGEKGFFGVDFGDAQRHSTQQIEFPLNSWIHIAFTHDGTFGKWYLDGNLNSVTRAHSIRRFGSGPFVIGLYTDGTGSFPGQIDELSLWNRTLSHTEIRALRVQPPAGDEPNLAGYWNFDGNSTRDQSSHQNDGTLLDSAELIEVPDTANKSPSGPILWSRELGGNGHYYELIPVEKNLEAAADDAEGLERNGLVGHLVTVTSEEENAFVSSLLSLNQINSSWLAGRNTGTDQGWIWVDGPEEDDPFWQGGNNGSPLGDAFAAWADGEPNGASNEDALIVQLPPNGSLGMWFDTLSSISAPHFVEYSSRPGGSVLIADTLSDQTQVDLHPAARTFTPPEGAAGDRTTGVLVKAHSSYATTGTTWELDFESNWESDLGLQFIHPLGNGHGIVTLHRRSIGMSTPGRWSEIGYGAGTIDEATYTDSFASIFPLNSGQSYSLKSTVTPNGDVSVVIDQQLVAAGTVNQPPPLVTSISGDVEFPGSTSPPVDTFSGTDFPAQWQSGYAGLIFEPIDQGNKTSSVVTFSPGPAAFTASNDDFERRSAISGSLATISQDNESASRQAGEPNHAGAAGGRSLWWSWNAPGNGFATIDTLGSNEDTIVAVYTGVTLENLTLVAENDDVPTGGTTSSVRFPVVEGTNYQIVVDTFDGAAGQIVLNIDAEIDRPVITSRLSGQNLILSWPSSARGFTLEATTDIGTPLWLPVDVTPSLSEDQNLVKIPSTESQSQFFRLRRPEP